MNYAPLLETERLRLRAHGENDLEDCLAMWSDSAVVQYIGGRPFTLEEVWARLLRYVGHWMVKGFGYWALEEKQSGRFAGEIGFADFKRNMTPPLDGVPELGWALPTWAHGRGYATEAGLRVIEWAQGTITGSRLVCLIHPENVASLRMASKLGFEQWLITEYKGSPAVLFERTLAR